MLGLPRAQTLRKCKENRVNSIRRAELQGSSLFVSTDGFTALLARALESPRLALCIFNSKLEGEPQTQKERTWQDCWAWLCMGFLHCLLTGMKWEAREQSPALPLTPNSLLPRYEEEVSLRATAENEFVALKKASSMEKGSRITRISGQTYLGESRKLSLVRAALTFPYQNGKFPNKQNFECCVQVLDKRQ